MNKQTNKQTENSANSNIKHVQYLPVPMQARGTCDHGDAWDGQSLEVSWRQQPTPPPARTTTKDVLV